MEVFNSVNYFVQERVLEKMFKENVKKNKADLLEELEDNYWIMWHDIWDKYDFHFRVGLFNFPNEVLLKKPYDSKIFSTLIKIDTADIRTCYNLESEGFDIEYCNCIFGIDENITYYTLLDLFNRELDLFSDDMDNEFLDLYDHNLELDPDLIIDSLELVKVDNEGDMETYKLEVNIGFIF